MYVEHMLQTAETYAMDIFDSDMFLINPFLNLDMKVIKVILI